MAGAQSFNLQTDHENITSLDGLWRFHTGDDPQWADPKFDDSQWKLLRSDESWTTQGYPGYGGFAWYRFSLETSGTEKPLSLGLTNIVTSYHIYANGVLLGGFGYMPPRKLALLDRPKAYALPLSGNSGPHRWSFWVFGTRCQRRSREIQRVQPHQPGQPLASAPICRVDRPSR
jgi:hypothetical protein